jgi:prevent-host-death family protein
MAHEENGRKDETPVAVSPARVSLKKARDILGELANRVEFREETIIITRRGKPAFGLVPLAEIGLADVA